MNAAILGAHGLIGRQVLGLLAEDQRFQTLHVITRRPLDQAGGSKVRPFVLDFADRTAFQQALEGCTVLFCAIGTTMRKVNGDRAAYRTVDYDIPVQAARLGLQAGLRHIVLVSSIGADPASNNFYLKLKGETEEAVRDSGVERLSIFRPSLLLGKRDEFRLGESISQKMMPLISFLFPAPYRPVHADQVARAMVVAARQSGPGYGLYTYPDILRLSGQF